MWLADNPGVVTVTWRGVEYRVLADAGARRCRRAGGRCGRSSGASCVSSSASPPSCRSAHGRGRREKGLARALARHDRGRRGRCASGGQTRGRRGPSARARADDQAPSRAGRAARRRPGEGHRRLQRDARTSRDARAWPARPACRGAPRRRSRGRSAIRDARQRACAGRLGGAGGPGRPDPARRLGRGAGDRRFQRRRPD